MCILLQETKEILQVNLAHPVQRVSQAALDAQV